MLKIVMVADCSEAQVANLRQQEFAIFAFNALLNA